MFRLNMVDITTGTPFACAKHRHGSRGASATGGVRRRRQGAQRRITAFATSNRPGPILVPTTGDDGPGCGRVDGR